MDNFRADLHCHSTYSDGTLTPQELVELAITKGLKGLSITDHDTVGAYPELFTYGKERGIAIIPGIEFSASHKDKPVHILGYSFSPTNSSIIKLCETHLVRRTQRNQAIIDRLAAIGLPIDADEMTAFGAKGSIGRPHIAAAMVKKGYVGSVQEAFKKYLREGGVG
ncbi:MAG: PHP domain-containing protein, partial [Nitrosomonas sp.]